MINLDEETLKPLKRSQTRRNTQSKGGKAPRMREFNPLHIILAVILAAAIAFFVLSREVSALTHIN
jgi:hypothetical protein